MAKIFLFMLLVSSKAWAGFPDPKALLETADRARGGLVKGIEWKVVLKTIESETSDSREFFVQAKGDDAFIEATSPARTRGEVYLFNDRDMWFFKPGLRKPVSISARQRLSGQAANGDIASTHYARDYEGVVSKKEKLGSEDVWVMDLKAKDKKVTYDRIRYFVSEKSKLALKAEFLNLDGEPFKEAHFEYKNSLVSGGEKIQFVSKMTIIDRQNSKNRSEIVYLDPVEKNIASSRFNINQLSR